MDNVLVHIFTVYSHQKSGKGGFDGGYKFYWVNMLYPPSHHICPPYHSLEAHPPLSGTVSTPSHTPPTNLHAYCIPKFYSILKIERKKLDSG
jgi:hypothetical protein